MRFEGQNDFGFRVGKNIWETEMPVALLINGPLDMAPSIFN